VANFFVFGQLSAWLLSLLSLLSRLTAKLFLLHTSLSLGEGFHHIYPIISDE